MRRLLVLVLVLVPLFVEAQGTSIMVLTWKKAAVVHYIITASAGSNGSISPSGAVSVASGGSPVFTITPNSGYVDSVYVDGTYNATASTNGTFTFSGVVANHTIWVNFQYGFIPLTAYSFPRTASLQWGGGSPDYLSKFSLLVVPTWDSARVVASKAINPSQLALATADLMEGYQFHTAGNTTIPSQWLTWAYTDTTMKYFGDPLVNYTSYCSTFTGSVNGFAVSNERFNQALPRMIVANTSTIFDGINSDGTWNKPPNHDVVDFDRNHLADESEGGKGESWVQAQWMGGISAMIDSLRARWGGSQKYVSFSFSFADSAYLRNVNGVGSEDPYTTNTPRTYNVLDSMLTRAERFGMTPRMDIIDMDLAYDVSHAPARLKDYFREMRWNLGQVLMHDSYFIQSDEFQGHNRNFWYDEFESNLGKATSLRLDSHDSLRVRFFEHGAVVVNVGANTATITDANLQTFPQYQGPYYRFAGNQDTSQNNGRVFSSLSLTSSTATYAGATQNLGDAIILKREIDTVVSDVIVDNALESTSPGSASATMTAGFTHYEITTNTVSHPAYHFGYPHDYLATDYWQMNAASGTGADSAAFTATINRPGLYSLWEWHAWKLDSNDSSAATNVPARVVSLFGAASDTTQIIIDQKHNVGQWNSLGTYGFGGGNAQVMIDNNANGVVLADAFKWKWVGAVPTDGVRPAPMTLTLDSTHNATTALRWTAPGNDSLTGTAVRYDIRYDTAPITSGDFTSHPRLLREPVPAVAGTAQSVIPTGLTAGNTYWFAAKSRDNVNWSAMSNVVTDTIPGAPIFDTTSYEVGGTSVVTKSWTHVCRGNYRYLIVSPVCSGVAGLDSVKYDGVKATQIGHSTLTNMWGLVNPDSGSHTVQVWYSNGNNTHFVNMAVSYTNVNQSTPIGTAATFTGTSVADSVSAGSAVNDVVVSVSGNGDGKNTHTPSGTGEVQRMGQSIGDGEAGYIDAIPGVATTTKSKGSWSGSCTWYSVAVALKHR